MRNLSVVLGEQERAEEYLTLAVIEDRENCIDEIAMAVECFGGYG
jgi:hypothetical protein